MFKNTLSKVAICFNFSIVDSLNKSVKSRLDCMYDKDQQTQTKEGEKIYSSKWKSETFLEVRKLYFKGKKVVKKEDK